MPVAYSGPVRGARHAQKTTAHTPSSIPTDRAAAIASAAVPTPNPSANSPSTRPTSVLGESTVYTCVGPFSVDSHPQPWPHTPTPSTSAARAASEIPAARDQPERRSGRPPTDHAAAHSRATAAGTFTSAADARTTVPSTHRPRRKATSPATISPIISASLWAPPTRCTSASGLSTAAHSAPASPAPHSDARRPMPHTISPSPTRATSRIPSTAATVWCSPVTATTARVAATASGP